MHKFYDINKPRLISSEEMVIFTFVSIVIMKTKLYLDK